MAAAQSPTQALPSVPVGFMGYPPPPPFPSQFQPNWVQPRQQQQGNIQSPSATCTSTYIATMNVPSTSTDGHC